MIILVTGTNGSGKSTLVRNILDRHEYRVPLHREGRKRPIGYLCRERRASQPLFVLGHYEIQNGGLDTMSTEEAFQTVYRFARQARVLFEGNRAASVIRLTELNRAFPGRLRIIGLTTSVPECIAAVAERGHHIADKTVSETEERVDRCLNRMSEVMPGRVERLDRSLALARVRSLLGDQT